MGYKKHFEKELEILRKKNQGEKLIIEDFIPDIESIIEKFSEQGHSGGSAPYYANTLSETIKNILLFKPLSPINDDDSSWNDVGNNVYQNNRECALFKDGKGGRAYYLDAIVWKGEDEWDSFTGTVNGISSRQYVRFPFTPKRIYIDLIKIYDTIENIDKLGENYSDDFDDNGKKTGKYFYYKIKNIEQLSEVYDYYNMIDSDLNSEEFNNFFKKKLRKQKINKILLK